MSYTQQKELRRAWAAFRKMPDYAMFKYCEEKRKKGDWVKRRVSGGLSSGVAKSRYNYRGK
jgi:hypothetical protein